MIYTAHGLLAVTSNSGVFSLHQFILFFHFLWLQYLTKHVGDKFEMLVTNLTVFVNANNDGEKIALATYTIEVILENMKIIYARNLAKILSR